MPLHESSKRSSVQRGAAPGAGDPAGRIVSGRRPGVF